MKHYDYPELDETCLCDICVVWRGSLAAYEASRATVADHGRSCRCPGCRVTRKLGSSYHAALNRRDLFCELSFHAAGRPPGGDDVNPKPPAWGIHLMEWAKREIGSPARTDGWWVERGPFLPIAHWLNRFTAFANAVSGNFAALASGAVG